MRRTLLCSRILLPEGWACDVAVTLDGAGRIEAVRRGFNADAEGERIAGPVLPALANIHSHAFQRAMAGLAETAGATEDSFWTWRDTMYRLVARLSPEQMESIAAKLYIELLKGGFGRVVEFHYLHHAWGAGRTDDSAEASRRIIEAARTVGIGLTHLPVFYAHAGFGGAEPSEGQRPFLHDVDGFLALLDTLAPECEAQGARLGLALHSLRAATPDEMRRILEAERTGGPIHIHVAEQEREVEECLAFTGRRPVDWMLDELPVDERWCAIHATHMTAGETLRLAGSGAVAGLCPATEASLGDGIFPATAFREAGGRIGIGTDSHVATDVAEELRLLEYGQRLRDRRRSRFVAGPGRSVGRTLFDAALQGGARAAGAGASGIAPGAPADLVVLDGNDPYLAAAEGDAILDRWIFALGRPAVRDVMIGGRWLVREGRHEKDEEIDAAFARTLLQLR
ncbi:formimidoylglutamate deiminase [Aureimonas populi]|uniref:Formimidoylglutamate deiminase n=1 Tax=Aureimonas populi TaxID=1701758 RepID=A0ABW5CP21_9HYPH|nr:formimidoylglutamate deiminase [Aureimonas populi]